MDKTLEQIIENIRSLQVSEKEKLSNLSAEDKQKFTEELWRILFEFESENDISKLKNDSSNETKSELYLGDCLKELRNIKADSIDLIFTSPPYADQRKNTYGGIHPDKYVEWFSQISSQLFRVLKPTGTFVLNIKEKVVDGERSLYVMDLIKAMRKQGWLWTEEFIWHKKNSYPGKWSNRFRDSWERLLQFNKQRKFNMYQDAVKVPIGDWAKSRLKNLSETDKKRDNARNGSGFGKNVSNWLNKETVYPTNVLHLATECNNKNHSAAFPKELPEWFIKLFTKEGDTVLDPFAGSGTTLVVAQEMNRSAIGIEIVPEYCDVIENQITIKRKPRKIKNKYANAS